MLTDDQIDEYIAKLRQTDRPNRRRQSLRHPAKTGGREMSELKDCPFCGSDKNLFWADGMRRISCTCGAEGPITDSKEDAMIAWNKRPDTWISVRDRLPTSDEGEEFICSVPETDKRPCFVSVYVFFLTQRDDSPGFYSFDAYNDDWKKCCDITHWMPLPKPHRRN